MTDGNRAKRNRRIQGMIGDLVKCRKTGILKTEKLVRLLGHIDSRWGLDAHQVGNLCKQREDLRKGDVNEWIIVEVAL